MTAVEWREMSRKWGYVDAVETDRLDREESETESSERRKSQVVV